MNNYACGNIPEVGDLISFGIKDKKLLITKISIDGTDIRIYSGDTVYKKHNLTDMRLVARHGGIITDDPILPNCNACYDRGYYDALNEVEKFIKGLNK